MYSLSLLGPGLEQSHPLPLALALPPQGRGRVHLLLLRASPSALVPSPLGAHRKLIPWATSSVSIPSTLPLPPHSQTCSSASVPLLMPSSLISRPQSLRLGPRRPPLPCLWLSPLPSPTDPASARSVSTAWVQVHGIQHLIHCCSSLPGLSSSSLDPLTVSLSLKIFSGPALLTEQPIRLQVWKRPRLPLSAPATPVTPTPPTLNCLTIL